MVCKEPCLERWESRIFSWFFGEGVGERHIFSIHDLKFSHLYMHWETHHGSQQGSTLDSLPTPFFFWVKTKTILDSDSSGWFYLLNKEKKWYPKTNRQPKHGSLILCPVTPLKVGKQACCLLALVVSHCSGPSCLWHPVGLLVSGYFLKIGKDQLSTSGKQAVLPSSWEVISNFPGGSDGKASAYNAGDLGSIPGSGSSPGEGNGNPRQYSCLENPMDGRAW